MTYGLGRRRERTLGLSCPRVGRVTGPAPKFVSLIAEMVFFRKVWRGFGCVAPDDPGSTPSDHQPPHHLCFEEYAGRIEHEVEPMIATTPCWRPTRIPNCKKLYP